MKLFSLNLLIFFLVISFSKNSFSLDKHHSNHAPKPKIDKPKTEQDYDIQNKIIKTDPVNIDPECKLNKKVYGWHPYWYGSSYKSYEYNLLSRISYFSLKVDPETGSFEDTHFWKTTPLIKLAKSSGTKVDLTITNFGEINNAEFLKSKKTQSKLIKNTIKLLKLRGADGVCLDFESVPGSMRDEFSDFINKFSKELKEKLPEATLSLTLYAVDWHKVFDIEDINPAVDLFILMAYDYHTASSKNAGPVAPIKSGKIWSPFNVRKSIEHYLKKGVPASKLLLSVPYYGQEWQTAKSKFPSKNIDHITTKPYRKIKDEKKIKWDKVSKTPVILNKKDNKNYQTWFDNKKSLDAKYKLVKELGLGGIGIFALGYDNGHEELWEAIADNFCEQ